MDTLKTDFKMGINRRLYFELENQYSKLCETDNLLWQVLTLREEVPKIYESLLKKEAKVWASRLQHPNIILTEEFTKVSNDLENLYICEKDLINNADNKESIIEIKSKENHAMLEEVERATEEIAKIKEKLLLKKSSRKICEITENKTINDK